jgi:hypothetical protein
MNTVSEVEIESRDGNAAVTIAEIKSKRDASHASGWSVIAFTPSSSIRCVKCHRDDYLSCFAASIIAACGGEWSPEQAQRVEDTILSIID